MNQGSNPMSPMPPPPIWPWACPASFFGISAIIASVVISRPATEAAMQGIAPSYGYYFDYVTETLRGAYPGALHAWEIPYVFGSLAARRTESVSAE